MSTAKNPLFCMILVLAVLGASMAGYCVETSAGAVPLVRFKQDTPGRLDIHIGGTVVATYVFNDPAIPRPYFANLVTISGVPVTRPNPPDPAVNKGNDDHATFHPGVWLAFGDLCGNDFWRNKAHVNHMRFIGVFEGEGKVGGFTVLNEYTGEDATVLCEETCYYTVECESPTDYSIISRSTFFSATTDLAFGDQEEMGVGVRLNTPLTVKFGSGRILNSEGGVNEAATWGRQATWCAAAGASGGRTVGVTLIPSPDNFRRAWFHTRDYGLLVANPFGKKSMTAPGNANVPADSTVVKKGQPFTFGWGLYVFDEPAGTEPDYAQVYNEYVRRLR